MIRELEMILSPLVWEWQECDTKIWGIVWNGYFGKKNNRKEV